MVVGVVLRGVLQEVGGHESPLSPQLTHEEAIVVHVPKDVDDVPSLKGELDLSRERQRGEGRERARRGNGEGKVGIGRGERRGGREGGRQT